MKNAKLKLKEFFSEDHGEQDMDDLKPKINNLLLMYLPLDTTLKECNAIAMVINDMIWNPRNYTTKPKQ